MNKGVNKVFIIGHLGADPETTNSHAGSSITKIRVATTQGWNDKQSGERTEHTEWHNIIFFNRLAEIAAQHLKKGSQVYIEGSLRTTNWQDKDNNKRYKTEIVANNMHMLSTKAPATNNLPTDDDFDDLPF